MMLIRFFSSLFLLLALIPKGQALEYDFSGYASFGGGRFNTSHLTLADYDDDLSFNTDSIVGVQLDLSLSNEWSALAQVVSKGYRISGEAKYKPKIDIAFLKYEPSKSWLIRLGRLPSDFYLYSDVREVGFAYPWMRPSLDMYSFFVSTFASSDGIDLQYRSRLNSWDFSASLVYGSLHAKTQAGDFSYSVNSDPVSGFNLALGNDTYTFRYGYVTLRHDVHSKDIDLFQKLVRIQAEEFEELEGFADLYTINNEPNIFQSVSLSADYGTWLIHAEMGENRTSRALNGDIQSAYISFAYQFERVTPYIVFGYSSNVLGSEIGNALAATYSGRLEEGKEPFVDLLRESVKEVGTTDAHQRTQTVGVRYDIADNLVLKFEAERFDLYEGNASGFFVVEGKTIPDEVWLFGFVVDVIF